MKVLVLGAGVIGTTSAWFLRERGHDVTVIERQSAAAMETSFANGGQISVSHIEPWANPSAPMKILRWLGQPDAPLLFRPRLDAQQIRWALQFLVECLPWRTRRNMLQILAISKYSGETLRALRAQTQLRYDDLQRGILQIYTDRQGFDDAAAAAELVRGYGIAREVKTADECVRIEPALAARRDWIVGGTYTASDETGDARKFTQGLAALAAQRGVVFRYGVSVESLAVVGDSVAGVRAVDGQNRHEIVSADAYVACLSSYTPKLLAPVGVKALVYPAKGYSATLPIVDSAVAPTVSMTDDAKKIVFHRCLGSRVLDRIEAGDALQRASDRQNAAAQSVSQHRPRHARLDDVGGFGKGACRHRVGPQARNRFRVHRHVVSTVRGHCGANAIGAVRSCLPPSARSR
jgi:D-amino-acid dehydrogenase